MDKNLGGEVRATRARDKHGHLVRDFIRSVAAREMSSPGLKTLMGSGLASPLTLRLGNSCILWHTGDLARRSLPGGQWTNEAKREATIMDVGRISWVAPDAALRLGTLCT